MKRFVGFFKKYLIPCEENDFKPYILRPQVVLFFCVMFLVLETAFLIGASVIVPRSKLFGLIMTNALIDGTNKSRTNSNLPALNENPLLDVAAQKKANDMVAMGYFAHTSPTGLSPWYWLSEAGYRFEIAGENLAVNFADSKDVTDAWLNSPEHRANILNSGFTEIGMATAQGNFEGRPAIYVVEFFGKPASVQIAVAVPAKPAAKPPKTLPPTLASASAASSTSTSTQPVILSAIAVSDHQTNLVQRTVAAPRRLVNYLYLLSILLFAIALLLNVFIKIRIQYSQPIFGGVIVILMAGLFFILNQYFASAGTVIF